jgi:hypothetical protein
LLAASGSPIKTHGPNWGGTLIGREGRPGVSTGRERANEQRQDRLSTPGAVNSKVVAFFAHAQPLRRAGGVGGAARASSRKRSTLAQATEPSAGGAPGGVAHRFSGPLKCQRGDQPQLEALALQKVSQRTMIVAGRFETDQHRCGGSTYVIGQALVIFGGVGHTKALPLRRNRLDQNLVTILAMSIATNVTALGVP